MATDIDEACDFTDTQVSSYNPIDGERQLIIGLDFGTSMTKVVVGDHGIVGGKMYAIPFKNNSYLQPTSLFLKEGIFNLCEGQRISELKYTLMTESSKIESAVTAYIALILRHVRYYFLKKYGNIYKRNKLIWAINIGVSSASFDNQALSDSFRLVALAGWYASVQEGHIDIQKIETALKISRKDLEDEKQGLYQYLEDGRLHLDLVHVVPEVIAEVIGYAKSPLRNEGMHFLVDIGATTTDVATLIIHRKEGEDIYPLLQADVQRLGVFELHKSRIEQMLKILPTNEDSRKRLSEFTSKVDEFSLLPPLEHYKKICNSCDINDTGFLIRFQKQLRSVLEKTKVNRNPVAKAWWTGLPIFICGGGSRSKLYKRAIIGQYDTWRKNKINISGCHLQELPKPNNLEASKLQSDEFHRLAVAYGLSFDEKTFISPSDIENIPNSQVAIANNPMQYKS